MRFLAIFLVFFSIAFGAPLKILSVKNSANEVQIAFNGAIASKDFARFAHKSGIFYSIKAELTIPRKHIALENGAEIVVAQNTKEFARIVISSDSINDLNFEIDEKTLILGFGRDNSAISDLFASLNLDSSDSQKNDSKDSRESSESDLNDSQDSPESKGDSDKNSPSLAEGDKGGGLESKSDSKNESNKNKTDSTPTKTLPKSFTQNKVVVLDAGHGGKDCGAKVGKVCEKTLTLNISNKTAEILKARGYKVFTTRSSDKYISLTDRTKLANDKNADIFISIHANALDKNAKNFKTTNGIETYFLSTARSERARKVAELENKDDIEVMNHFSKLSFLNSLNSQRLLASNKLAIDVQSGMLLNARTLYKKTLDGGVREGPFWVLAGALMPSILIEVGYMTNATDLERLQNKNYQNALAKGIADGIDGYFAKNF